MEFILVVLIVFANGATQTFAIATASADECQQKTEWVKTQVADHNTVEANKIAWYAAACAAPKKAPAGTGV